MGSISLPFRCSEELTVRYGIEIGDAEALRESELALMVRSHKYHKTLWFPKSAIHQDSEVYRYAHLGSPSHGTKGALILKTWWARKNRYDPNRPNYLERR